MPKTINVEGVGPLTFPDDASDDDILQAVNRDYKQGGDKGPSALESFAGHAAAGVAPGAGFMAAAIPGAEAGAAAGTALAPLAGPFAPAMPAVGGMVGGMATGMAGSALVQKAQKGLLNLIDPGWGEEAEQGLAKQSATHPWASMAGDVASMGASARTLPETGFKMAQLPMRLALGAGMGAAMPVVTEGRLPTAPELVGGGLMFGLFGEARGTEVPQPRVPATAEQRSQRESAFAGALEKQGMNLKQVVSGAIPGRPNDVMHTLPDGSVVVSRDQFHDKLENYLAKGKTPEEGIANMIEEEAIHDAVPDEEALKVWNSMTQAEQWILKRIYHGPGMYKTRPLTPTGYGHEAIRFFLQKERGDPTEYTFGSKDELAASRILGAIESAVRRSRELLGTEASQVQKDALQRMLDKVKVSKEEIRKGVKDALSQPEATKVHGDVQPQPIEGQGEVPAQEGGSGVLTPTKDLAKETQVPLSEQSPVDRVSGTTKPAGNITKRNPLPADLEDNLLGQLRANNPLSGEVKSGVLSSLKDPEVFNSIVPLLPVNVVDQLMGFKGASKVVLHNPSMLLDTLARDLDAPVAKGFLRAVGRASAGIRAVLSQGGVGGLDFEVLPADVASHVSEGSTPKTQAQIPLTPQKDRSGALIKDPPVVKDVPPGSIHPDSIVPAIRLINGDVVHGWIKKNGQAATHPEIAKRYGITVEELDRKGWISKDGKAFYEREPAAVGTQLPTAKKEGELHSTDKPAEPTQPGIDVPKPDLSVVDKPVTEKEFGKYDSKNFAVMHAGTDLNTGEPLYWIVRKVSSLKSANPKEVPPVAQPKGAQQRQVPTGSKAPAGAATPAGPAAVTPISSTADPVKAQQLQAIVQRTTELQRQPFSIANVREMQKLAQEQYRLEGELGHNLERQGGEVMPMAAKESLPPMDEKQVLVRIAAALHGTSLDPESRKATFNEVSDLILTQPKENWGPILTQFEAQFEDKQISETEKQIARVSGMVESGQIPGISPEARIVDPAAIESKIKDIFGGLDLKGLEARLIFELNHEPEVVPGGKSRTVKTKMGGLKGTEEISSSFREPDYTYRGLWGDVWKAIHERDPSLPESLVRDRYVNRAHQFLAYAPSETLRRLIIASGAADRFLGREIVTDEEGQRVVRYTRTIPEPNLEPAVMDMGKAPSPDNPTEFEKFCLAKGITADRGKQLLEEYRTEWGRRKMELDRQEEALKSKYAPPPGATKAEAEALMKQGRSAIAEFNRFKAEEKKGNRINRERRDNAVNFLADWLVDESAPPEALTNRSEIDLDQIWFDHPDGHQGYREFTPEQGENSLFLREYLGRGAQVPGRTASKFTRGVTVVIGPDKTVSALSTYRHPTNGQVMIYDPASAPGQKNAGYIRLNKVLGLGYKVKSYLLVRDPLTDFHQHWTPEGERSAENVFDSRIGTNAELQGRGKMVAMTSLINEGVRPEGSELDDTGEVTPESMYALNAWLHSKGGQTWGFFGTDPQALIRGPVTAVEADALYRAFKENKVQSVEDWERVFDRMKSDRKIAESKPLAEMFRLQPWEYCFTSAIEKIARKRYRELVTGTGHYGPDPKTGFPNPEATDFRNKINQYPPLPKGFAEEYVKLAGEKADKMWSTLTEDQKTRYRLVEYHRMNELLNALQYAYETAKEIQAKHVSGGGARDVAGPIATSPDTLAFRQRAIADYGDTARREVEQDAIRKTVSRQYTGRPVPRVRGPVPDPGEPLSARGITEQVPLRVKPNLTARQQEYVRRQAFREPPPKPSREGPLPINLQRRLVTGGFVPQEHPPGRNLLREPGTEQTVMRKIEEQSREPQYGRPQRTLAMAAKDDPRTIYNKIHGVANVYQRQMNEEGRAKINFADPEDAPLATKQQMIQEGRDAVVNGNIQPITAMIHAKQTAQKGGAPYLSWKGIAAMRYHDYQLQKMADTLADQHSPQAEEAMKMANEWHKDFNEIAKKSAAHSMHVLQGKSIIGPGDMQSITFVRRMYERARAAAEGYEEGEEYDLTPQEYEWVAEKVKAIKGEAQKVEGTAKKLDQASQGGVETVHDPGNQIAIERANKELEAIARRAESSLKSRKPPGPFEATAMAQKEGEGAAHKLDDQDAVDLVDRGMTIMSELSASGKMSDANWKRAMIEMLNSENVQRPDLEVHLDHIRALAEKTRMDFINNKVGTGDPYKSAREHFTRKQPTIEESMAAIRRALAYPEERKITPMEAYHIWNYLRLRFFNAEKPDWDIRTIREKAGQELGVSATRLFRAMSSNRSMREPTDALLKQMRDEQRVRSQATNWLKNLEYPGWFRTLRAFPRLFFFDKILGHGLVPLITHSSNMLFNPYAWGTYFKAWPEMYKMAITGGKIEGQKYGAAEYHSKRMQELMGHERFEWWKRRGLEHDPFKYSDDYLNEWLYNLFEEKGLGGRALGKLGIPGKEFLQAMVGGRSFDVLKQLRYARAEQWLQSVPEHLRTKDMGDLIAQSVNHATGIVNKNFGEAGNWLLFAPKLEASRWAWLFRDTIKAADYLRKSDATDYQKNWAKTELKQKAAILGMYWGMLGINQGFLKMLGSDQDINVTDPTKPDFMQFKAAGFKVGVLSPIIGIYRLFATLAHDTMGERSRFEKLTTRQRAVGEHLFEYARGKASPIASFGLEAATAQSTYPTRPLGFLPWSEGLTRKQRMAGLTPYTAGEYAAETFTPIPLEEMVKETWGEMGVDQDTQNKWWRALIIGGTMSATGARVSSDVQR